MKALIILGLTLFSAGAFAHGHEHRASGLTCHQGYEYKMVRDSFGKVAFVPTGRRCERR